MLKKQRTLGAGPNALRVSALGLGAMGMNHGYGPNPGDRKDMIAVLRGAVERGVTFFDTAEGYGPFLNEELVGEALAPFKGQVVIGTKFGWNWDDPEHPTRASQPESIKKACDACLKRLKVDRLDLFYQHRVNPDVPTEDVAGTIKELMQAGKVKHWGMCEAKPERLRRAHAVQPLTTVQYEFSLWNRRVEFEIMPVLDELGIGLVPYSPLGKGFLTGTVDANSKFVGDDTRKRIPRFTPEAMASNRALVDLLAAIGARKGASPAQVALGWLLAKRPYIVPIPGTRRISRLEENIAAADLDLTAADVKEIEDAAAKIEIKGARYPQELEDLSYL